MYSFLVKGFARAVWRPVSRMWKWAANYTDIRWTYLAAIAHRFGASRVGASLARHPARLVFCPGGGTIAAPLKSGAVVPRFRSAHHESAMSNQPVYKVIFKNGGEIFEVFARQIYQSDMWGFIEVEEFVFGERSQILVDPGEEKLKKEFNGVQRSYIPMQAIIRIDEVDREGSVRVSELAPVEGNVASFPFAGPHPGQQGQEE